MQPPCPGMSRVTVFFSYSPKDASLRDELDRHLTPLKQSGAISSWHDQEILPGSPRDEEINERLRTVDIILLLISADFLASDFVHLQVRH